MFYGRGQPIELELFVVGSRAWRNGPVVEDLAQVLLLLVAQRFQGRLPMNAGWTQIEDSELVANYHKLGGVSASIVQVEKYRTKVEAMPTSEPAPVRDGPLL